MTYANAYCGKCGNKLLHNVERGCVCEWCEHVAEIAALRARVMVLEAVLAEVRDWCRPAVGLDPPPKTDAETLGDRIDAALATPSPTGGKVPR